jgi:hypothetical protein
MKFKIRDGFVLKRVDYVTVDDETQEREMKNYAGETVDLSAEQATEHLHQLEPVDKAAIAFVESRFVPSAEVSQLVGGIGPDIQAFIQKSITDGIQAGVTAALAAAQAQVPAAAASTPAAS